jgi:hypothetical protein
MDERRQGASLGLTIVLDVLAAYGRRLELGTSDVGGLKATIAPPARRWGNRGRLITANNWTRKV